MLKRMLWIGLTGGIASGKSTVAQLFKGRGVPVVDADLIAKQVVGPGTSGLKAVLDRFGAQFENSVGELDRRALGAHVFQDPKALSDLEDLLHPLVQEEVQQQKSRAEKKGSPFAIYDVPLLFEKNLQQQFDGVITVVSSLGSQKLRMKNRDGLSDEQIENRLRAQLPMQEKILRSRWLIENDSDLKNLEFQFEKVFNDIQSSKT